MYQRPSPPRHLVAAAALAAVLVSACGGGGTGSPGGPAIQPGVNPPVATVGGPDSFLLFPNPQRQADGRQQVNTQAYASAYYQAIDPQNERDTLAKFKARNGFGKTGDGSVEETIIIGDQRDLGYGRKMTGRQNADGSLAFVVENYLTGGYGAYTSLSVDAAVVGENKWHVGTNGIEFSPGPGGSVNFVKFYTFDPVSGARQLMADLDGRGDKAMPTICTSCHGGRGDALTPSGLFPRVMNVASSADVKLPERGGMRGDVAAQLHAFEPSSFDFSSVSAYTRASMEGKIKTLNKMVLCGFNLPAGTQKPTGFAEDACRRVANPNEYQGTAAPHLKNMYGGDGLPNAASAVTDTFLPPTWQAFGQSSLYANTVSQSCRVCHSLRGTGNQSDISFDDFTRFDTYADRIKAHVIDRGNMPLAKLVYDKYWSTPSINGTMATYLASRGYADAFAKPGRPIADPGPSRVVKSRTTALRADMSLFSTTYQWSIASGPTGASLTGPTTATPTFTATADGTYVLTLVTGNGSTTSAPATMTLVVNQGLSWDPSAVTFSDVKTVLQAGQASCTACHTSSRNPAAQNLTPPVFYDDYDRAGTGDGSDAINRQWLYADVRGRVNLTDLAASPLLRKPSGNHHGGGVDALAGFNTSLPPGDSGRADYDKVLAWILNGAPE